MKHNRFDWRFDWAIKKILRDKVNYVILEGFIRELIGQPIKIESSLESESNQFAEDIKLNRVDILARSAIEAIHHIFPEYYLLRVNKFDNETKDSLDEWIYFLKNSEIKDNFSAQGLPEAKDRLQEEHLASTKNLKLHFF